MSFTHYISVLLFCLSGTCCPLHFSLFIIQWFSSLSGTCYTPRFSCIIFQLSPYVSLAPVVLHVFHSLSLCGPLLYVWHLLSTTSFTRYLSVVLFPMSGTCCPPRFSLVCSSTRCLPHHFLSYHPSVQSTLSNLSHARFHLLSSILDIIFSSAFTLFQLGSDKPYTYWPRSLVILPTLQTD